MTPTRIVLAHHQARAMLDTAACDARITAAENVRTSVGDTREHWLAVLAEIERLQDARHRRISQQDIDRHERLDAEGRLDCAADGCPICERRTR